MNPKTLILASLIAAAAMFANAQAPASAPTPEPPPAADVAPAPAEPAVAPAKETAQYEVAPDVAPAPKPKKRARISSSSPKATARVETRVETRDENGDVVVRHFGGGEGAPGVFERHVERFDNDNETGPIRKEVRIYRDENGEHQDVFIHSRPEGPGLRAEIGPRPPRAPQPLVAGPLIAGELTPERADHLEQAIRHLHAAGLDPLADRLQARVDRFHAEKGGPGPDRALREEIARLREEHQKLQRELRKLQKEMQSNGKEKGPKE